MREFPSGIQSRPRARQRPIYHKTSWLDVVRAEKRLKQKQAQVAKVLANAYAYGNGIWLNSVEPTEFYALQSAKAKGE